MKPSKLSFFKVWKQSVFLILFVLAGLLSLSACQNKAKPSFLIIGIDRLAFNSFSCVDEKSSASSGLSLLCKEALRFTHAYTTSTHPAAAIASLLSAQLPYAHNVHRSSDRVFPKLKLLSEVADDNHYRTAFYSGSPAVLRKTGLARGFDFFDDTTFLERKNYLADFQKQAEEALNWIEESTDPSFTFIYNSELEALNEGESDISTFEKLDEKLAHFFNDLKAANQWESSYVIVVGLEGKSDYSRPNEGLISNLHSENSNIVLFIKPPRQKGDEGIHSKVDAPVQLSDLGLSLIRTIDEQFLQPSDDFFSVVDFSSLWKKANTQSEKEDLLEDRKILIESANPWSKEVETRYAIIYRNLIYIENENDELYNTLTDGLETIDISSSATSGQNDFKNENRKALAELRNLKNQLPWRHEYLDDNDFVISNREYWSKPNSRLQIFDLEFKRFQATRRSQPLTGLMLQSLVSNNKFDLIKSLGLRFNLQRPVSEKEIYFDDVRRQSLNLSLENLWGLWRKDKNWIQPPLIVEYQ